MPKLIVIDHSLQGVGGHHYEYDLSILRAAASAGFELVLATHARFRKHRGRFADCQVFSPFRHETYSDHSILVRLDGPPQNPYRASTKSESAGADDRRESPLRRLKSWYCRWRQRICLDRFLRHCHELFQRIDTRAGDQVFVPTCSEFDLVGFVQFLKSFPRGRELDWHLQFHFNFLDGAEPDYLRQPDRLAQMRDHFGWLLRQVPEFRLHFYATTDQMVAQFNRLETARFQLLAYPISPSFQPTPLSETRVGPLRVLCAGGARHEKGAHHLEPLLQSLWQEFFATRKLQLLVQARRSLSLPQPPSDAGDPALDQPAVVHIPHPLSAAEYCDLVRNADIGLFLYDRQRYYARCSGVLVEMLCSGVPVIVPAGCWLAEEIAGANYEHLDTLARTLPVVQRVSSDELRWFNESTPRCKVSLTDQSAAASFELPVPKSATELWLAFQRCSPSAPGHYVRLDCEQFDRNGRRLNHFAATTGERQHDAAVPILFHLIPGATRVRVSWSNAFHNTELIVTNVDVRFLDATACGGSCPSGSVGLIAADRDQFAPLLQEMTAHYAHYRQQAREFSQSYRATHDPRRVVEQLAAATQIAADRPQAA